MVDRVQDELKSGRRDPGKLPDSVVLSDDLLTIVNGKAVYEKT